MQDLLREMALVRSTSSVCCRNVRYWLNKYNLDLDPRYGKPCYGYACFYCQHAKACKAGETELLYIPEEGIREMVTEEAMFIFDFDGTSLGQEQY